MDGKPCIVAVNAISGGGKTAITNKLQKRLPHAQALYFDDRNYDEDSGIEDICAWMENGADVQAFDLQRLADDIENLCRSSLDYILLDYPFGYKHHLIAPYIWRWRDAFSVIMTALLPAVFWGIWNTIYPGAGMPICMAWMKQGNAPIWL